MDDDALLDCVKSHSVFGRTSPKHKLRLVKAMQEHGSLVAMTGEGRDGARRRQLREHRAAVEERVRLPT